MSSTIEIIELSSFYSIMIVSGIILRFWVKYHDKREECDVMTAEEEE